MTDQFDSKIPTSTASMTSLQISELVESRHDKVLQSIERLVKKGVIQEPPLGFRERINGLGHTQRDKMYVFSGQQGKRDSTVVVAQLSPEFTARLVDRWEELEKKLQKTPEQLLAAYWAKYRHGAASNYNILMREVDKVTQARFPDEPSWSDKFQEEKRFARVTEADFLNDILIGMPAHVYRATFGEHNQSIRDKFPAKLLDAYEQAEILDATLLAGCVPRGERRAAIERMISLKYPQLKMFRDVMAEDIRKLNFCEVPPDWKPEHPARYKELKADQELLDLLEFQDTILLADAWDELNKLG